MKHTFLYNDFNSFFERHFKEKVREISLSAGFSCPNRDGTAGYGGCTYCNNQTFNPEYCHTDKSVTQQLNEETLPRINRGHSFETAKETIEKTANASIMTGAHIIPGLPGKDHDELMRQAGMISQLPLTTLKPRQSQLIKRTPDEHHFPIAPDRRLKNHEFTDKMKKRMRERNTHQGKSYQSIN